MKELTEEEIYEVIERGVERAIFKILATPKSLTCQLACQQNAIGQCVHDFGFPPAALGSYTPGMKICRKCGASGFPGV